MNYAEELVYWYFRFNGFFLLNNFVLHREGERKYCSDNDILAIRHPHVFEEVGGKSQDWDDKLTSIYDFEKVLGVICEVKSGYFESTKVLKEEYLENILNRFGFFSVFQKFNVLQNISKNRKTSFENYQIGKILVCNRDFENNYFDVINLEHIIEFIYERIRNYKQDKFADRIFFPSNLMQFLMDKKLY